MTEGKPKDAFKEAKVAPPIEIDKDWYVNEDWLNPSFETNEINSKVAEFMQKVLSSADKYSDGKKVNHPLFHQLGEYCRRIAEGQASYDALEVIYKFPYLPEATNVENIDPETLARLYDRVVDEGVELSGLEKLQLQKMWIIEMDNAKAVRNRHALIRSNLIKEIQELDKKKKELSDKTPIKISSIACGSAMAVSEAVYWCKNSGLESEVDLLLSDQNPQAIRRAIDYARTLGVKVRGSQDNFVNPSQRPALEALNGESDIVEIAGLIDYFKRPTIESFWESCKKMLKDGGKLVTCNIMPNGEQDILHNLIGWMPMKYRNVDDLKELSFSSPERTIIITEPKSIHSIMIIEN